MMAQLNIDRFGLDLGRSAQSVASRGRSSSHGIYGDAASPFGGAVVARREPPGSLNVRNFQIGGFMDRLFRTPLCWHCCYTVCHSFSKKL